MDLFDLYASEWEQQHELLLAIQAQLPKRKLVLTSDDETKTPPGKKAKK